MTKKYAAGPSQGARPAKGSWFHQCRTAQENRRIILARMALRAAAHQEQAKEQEGARG